MLKLEIILAENDVMNISEGLKEIGVGGLTVIKARGRGAKTAAEIHTSKGMEIFVPHFADKYRINVVRVCVSTTYMLTLRTKCGVRV